MKKSLVIIASALLVAVGAANHDRLRYDSTVFADARTPSGARAVRVEYPPCIKGVREDRCIQLYERGMRRSYARWLAAHGRGDRLAAHAPARTYRACRGRNDDRCQQGAVRHRAQAARRAHHQRAQRVQQRAERVQSRAATHHAVRTTPRATVVRTSVQPRRPVQVERRRPGPPSTPGI